MGRILVLSEARGRVDEVEAALVARGYQVRVVPANRRGVADVGTFWPDLVLVHFDGRARVDLVSAVRGRLGVPLMVWANCQDREDAVRALQQGADDYVGGQVAVEELAARVGAQLRRVRWSCPHPT
ncbi:MAG: hypothetical protein JXM73_18610 [Anaerolineae bacterium]|nr:hypothetical protein [Anaerolineae bacterium]